MTILALTRHTGERLAEIGFVLIVLAGVWLAVAQLPRLGGLGAARLAVPGVLLAVGALLVIVAIHWGYFGSFFA
jgi:hypothetical protein